MQLAGRIIYKCLTAVISNLSVLFCTGLAAALAKREKHQAAFIALMSYLVYLTAGNVTLTELGLLAQPDALTGLYSAGQTMVLGIQTVDTGVFGGVLLGAGGLVRAYTQGAVVALKAAQVVEMLPSCQYLCEVAYPLWDKVQYALKSLPVQLLGSEFTTAVGFTLLIRQTDAQSVLDTLTRVTDGRIETLLEEESYRAWDSESK